MCNQPADTPNVLPSEVSACVAVTAVKLKSAIGRIVLKDGFIYIPLIEVEKRFESTAKCRELIYKWNDWLIKIT